MFYEQEREKDKAEAEAVEKGSAEKDDDLEATMDINQLKDDVLKQWKKLQQTMKEMLMEHSRKNQIMPPKVIPVIQVDNRSACCEEELETLQERLSEGEKEKSIEKSHIRIREDPSSCRRPPAPREATARSTDWGPLQVPIGPQESSGPKNPRAPRILGPQGGIVSGTHEPSSRVAV